MRAVPVDGRRYTTAVWQRVAGWLEHNQHLEHIALYHPLPDEPDLLPLMDRVAGRFWHFPRIAGDEMTFHPVTSPAADLRPGAFGIMEPIATLPVTPPAAIHAFLCPGLAFAPTTGCRLGRGKGYYDRYLAQRSTSARLAGVTFPERLVENTFAEPHDIRMDLVFY
jgi:5-formyltetrahydrofolate cyclo-ligase